MGVLIYLHGFRSSSQGVKAKLLREALDAMPRDRRPSLWVPDLPHCPAAAIDVVARHVEAAGDPARSTFIGSSLGFAELVALKVGRVTQPQRYLLLVESGDEVLDYREAIAFYAGAWQHVQGGGDHAYQGFVDQISAILRFAEQADRDEVTPA